MPATQSSADATPDLSGLTIGVLGGTGDQGRGLARRFTMAGLTVIIGSRDAGRAATAATACAASAGPETAGAAPTAGATPRVTGLANAECAAAADVVVVAVPWDGHRELLASLAGALAGKIVIDCVNPMGFDNRGAYP